MSLGRRPALVSGDLCNRGPRIAQHVEVFLRFLWLASILYLIPAAAFGQETRTETISAQQADKATRLAPYQRHRAETLLLSVRRAVIELPAGFYPYFGSVYSGGGFTLGGGYRGFTGDRTNWNVAGLYSAKGYKLIEAGMTSPGHLGGRLALHGGALWRDATQVAYHGLGTNSPADAGTAFRMQQGIMGGDVTVRPHRWLRFMVGTAVEDYTLKDPTGGGTPVEDTFTPATAPGLGVDPVYLHTTIAAAFDWRPAAEYARRGGLYKVERHDYVDRDSTYSFSQLETELVEHIPILRENWVISLRARLQTTLNDDDQVPYFLLPALGSGSTLRGYSSWRFRDRHGMLLSGEWRWIPNRMALDMAVFYDTGMVAPALDRIALNAFIHDFGIGIRFHTPVATPLRVELAQGSEGVRLVFAASAAF